MHVRIWLLALIAWSACATGDNDARRPDAIAGPSAPELRWRESPDHAERAPISLTASDGTGLVLVSVRARSVIEDPLAFTELHLTFHNPEPRRREGRFEISLPAAAAISRFAMRVGDDLQEGEVVERRRAQQVYEDFLHRKQDPALLEKAAGNAFSARVFPIEANADKEIIVAYSEELATRGEPYRLLLQGLPKLSELAVDVRLGSSSANGLESSDRARGSLAQLTLREREYVPSADLEVRLPRSKPFALRSGNRVVARVAPVPALAPAALDGLTVLFDTSASRALSFAAQIERLGALLERLRGAAKHDFDLRVVAFDQGVEEMYRGPASGFAMREKAKLLAREALGASDVAQALAQLAREPSGHARVLLVGDGVITAGIDDLTGLREAVAKLGAHGVRRLDVLAEGGIQDTAVLSSLARAGLAEAGVVLDARLDLDTLTRKLLSATRARIEVQIAGAAWVYPRVLEGIQPGDEHLVFAELAPGSPLQIELAGLQAEQIETLEAPAALLERACARAEIAAQTEALRALALDAHTERARLEQQIVALSLKHRVVSDLTAMLVLEGPNDYARFGIAQEALTSILRVGDEGIELFDRTGRAPFIPIEPPVALERFEAPSDGRERKVEAARDELASLGGLDDRAPETAARGGDLEKGSAAPARRSRAEAPEQDWADTAQPAAKAEAEAPSEFGRSGGGGFSSPKPAAPAAAAPVPARPPPAPEPARVAEGSTGAPAQSRAARSTGSASISGPAADKVAAGAPLPDLERFDPPGAVVMMPVLEARALVRLHQAFGLDGTQAASALRSGLGGSAKACYARAATRASGTERLALEFSLSDKGAVSAVFVSSGRLADARVQACILAAAERVRFPKPESGRASVQAGVELSMAAPEAPRATPVAAAARQRPVKIPMPALEDAYSGELAAVLAALAKGDRAQAVSQARALHERDPGDVLGLIALGEALEAQQDFARAARAYGSLIDLFPARADLRRMAGARLERLPAGAGLALASDSYARAVAQRPDHPSGHRLLAYALLKQGERQSAFEAIQRALARRYAWDRFEGADRILREDLGLIGAALVRAEPARESEVRTTLASLGAKLADTASLRFVLNWETDANDVDFHIYDGRGGHAYYMRPRLGSGGALYADITSGYGPECFALEGKSRAFPYVLQAHYFARGPMGYGMGKLQVIEHDGKGGLKFGEHPFVIMKDKAFVQLARLDGPLS